MGPGPSRVLRLFVAASLLLGGALLLAEARILRARPPGAEWTIAAVASWLAVLALFAIRSTWPWQVPAATLLASVLLAVAWSHFDLAGHLVVSGLTPGVALLTGVGIFLRRRWAWFVGFGLVAGIGPLFLAFAPLPDAAYAGAFALFVANALALLALADTYVGKPAGAA